MLYIVLLLRPTSCFGATSGKQDRALDSEQQCAYSIFNNPAANLAPYELNFQLLVRGACLLAGIAFAPQISLIHTQIIIQYIRVITYQKHIETYENIYFSLFISS